jgi:hypothetical protein
MFPFLSGRDPDQGLLHRHVGEEAFDGFQQGRHGAMQPVGGDGPLQAESNRLDRVQV